MNSKHSKTEELQKTECEVFEQIFDCLAALEKRIADCELKIEKNNQK